MGKKIFTCVSNIKKKEKDDIVVNIPNINGENIEYKGKLIDYHSFECNTKHVIEHYLS